MTMSQVYVGELGVNKLGDCDSIQHEGLRVAVKKNTRKTRHSRPRSGIRSQGCRSR
jgi:hypothetical protein